VPPSSIKALSRRRWPRDQLGSRLFGNGVVMAQIVEFPRGAIVFDPEIIKIVAQALDDAWDKIAKSGSEFARPAYANATREEIAKHMIEVAGRGERDQRILAEDAVRFLAENYKF
jgi:hypothetical protein